MTISLSLGWWLAPLAVTIIAFAWHFLLWANQPPPSGYGAIGDGIAATASFLLALVVSLVAWLIWAVIF